MRLRSSPRPCWCPLLSSGFPPGRPKSRFPGSHPPAGRPANDLSLGLAVTKKDQGIGCACLCVCACVCASVYACLCVYLCVRLCVCLQTSPSRREGGLTRRLEEVVNSGCVPAEPLKSCCRRARGLPRLLRGRTGARAGGRRGPGPRDCPGPTDTGPGAQPQSHCPVGSAQGHRAPL